MLVTTIHSFKKKNFWVGSHNSDLANRDKVLDELRNFFGYENVVPISNVNAFKVKSLIKDLSKFYGVPFDEVNIATRTVEQSVRKATMKHGDDKNLFVLTYDEALKYDEPFRSFIEKHPKVGESMNILFKQGRSLGRHAGGVLIADDLPNKMPLITSGGEPQTPWVEGVNFKHLEKIGNFIKYDLLGLETLRLIERSIELIIKKQGMFEFELDGTVHRLPGCVKVKLESGEFIEARFLTDDHDVALPIETNWQ
jgi:DNA polymerase III alpha subunit